MSTYLGGLTSLFIVSLLFLYGTFKLKDLATRSNPNISTALIENQYDKTDEINLNDLNFRIAFTVEAQKDSLQESTL